MKLFLSYGLGPWDGPIAARLRAVASAYDVSILLPDRTQVLHNGLAADTRGKIAQSDAVIALVTVSAPPDAVGVVNLELQQATSAGKPVIALVEQGVQFQSAPNTHLVYFDRLDPTAHETYLMNALDHIRKQKWKHDLAALGWIAGIALGLVALSQLLTDENNDPDKVARSTSGRH